MTSCQTAGRWPTRKRYSSTGTSKTVRLANARPANESKEGPSTPDIQQVFNGHGVRTAKGLDLAH